MTFDLVIRNGLVVDGTGAPRRRADVAVSDGRIVEIGDVSGTAKRTIDAEGLIVAPGFIDPHTHYDAQVCWDPEVSPSSWHGVTTVVTGNCGVGVAPCRPESRDILAGDLVNLESIPLRALQAGLPWDWEDFPSYMAATLRRGVALNIGFMAALTPFRHWVLGEDSVERAATADERDRIQAMLAEAMAAGALGFSTSISGIDVGWGGRPLACRLADQDELSAYADVLKRCGRGLTMTHISGELNERDYALLDNLLERSGRPVTWLGLFIRGDDPESAFRTLDRHAPLHRRGSVPQISCRPMLFSFDLRNPFVFASRPSTARVLNQSVEAQKRLYADPEFRRVFCDEVRAGSSGPAFRSCEHVEISETQSPALKALEGKTIANVAAERGRASGFEFLLDLALEDDLRMRFVAPILNTDEDRLGRLVSDPRVLIALSDGGAHLDQLCDAGYPTYLLGHWVREREVMPLERAVARLTSEPADLFGLADRGRLAAGKAADIAIFDADTVGSGRRGVLRSDLPGGGRRFVMPAQGVAYTIVNGAPVHEHGAYTGETPGRIAAPAGCA